MIEADLRITVLLALQNALLNQVTINIRAVMCNWNSSEVNVLVVFDGEVSEKDIENLSEIETEVLAHFTELNVRVKPIQINQPDPIPVSGTNVLVFKRSEEYEHSRGD